MNANQSKTLHLLIGGVIPLIAFTVIEDIYGVKAGLIAGLNFGFGEVIFELIKYKKVSLTTWLSNSLLFFLGMISLYFDDGLWFKMQPAMIEGMMFIFLLGSWTLKKPFLKSMIEKQNPEIPENVKVAFSSITVRLSLFFLFHCLLAVYAALYWTTAQWALLKGVGLTVSLILYLVIEILFIRFKIQKEMIHSQSNSIKKKSQE